MPSIDLFNLDCFSFLPTVEPDSIDLIVADPPYGGILKEDWDEISNYYTYSKLWLQECKRILKDTGSIYIWCSIGPKSSSLLDIASILKEDFIFQDMIVWMKQRGRGNRKGWLFTREEILWATKTKEYIWNKEYQYNTIKYDPSWIKRLGKENNPYKRATNVWIDIEEVSIEQARLSGGKGKREILHPAQKPIKALERIIMAHTNRGDLVLDPFMGSGTTGVVCNTTGRNFIGIERDTSYFNLAKNRIKGEQ